MVRLGDLSAIDLDRIYEFQFHHGTIGRNMLIGTDQMSDAFQFHHGTIGRYNHAPVTVEYYDISIPSWYDWESNVGKNIMRKALFQFHHGTIGSRSTTQKK